ncbi:PilI type IV pilus biogenesis protein [Escherichia coli]
MTVQLLLFPFRKESLMPQQHPGRLQILVVDTHCKRRLFSTKTPTDPDELARRFCTPDNCLVVVLRDNRFLFRLERAPGSHCRWHKGSSSRHQYLQDWLFKSKNNCKSFETNTNLLDKNGKPVEIMVCDDQELHFFVPKN